MQQRNNEILLVAFASFGHSSNPELISLTPVDMTLL